MKKNFVYGLLVAALTLPTFASAQDATAPDSILTDSAALVAAADSVPQKAKKERVKKERVYPVDSVHYTQGHVLSVGFGFGMSGLWSDGENIKNGIGFPGFNASLRYTYYFLKYMGFTTGVDFSTYRAEASLEGMMNLENNKTDLGQEYLHQLNFDGNSEWKEMQNIQMVEVPIALSFKAKPHHVGFLGTVGLKLAFPVFGSYTYKGNLNHQGAFNQYGYVEAADTHFGTQNVSQEESIEIKRNTMNVVNCNLFGEVGILFQVHPRVDMSVSFYGNYGLNDLNSTPHRDRAEFVEAYQYGAAFNQGYYQSHNGLFGAAIVDRVKPWNFGIKIAAHINVNKKSDEQKAAESYIAPEMVNDTITLVDTVYVHDTVEVVIKETIEKKVEQITKMLEKVIIYYNVGDSKTPIINPANMLDSVATIIAENPQIRVAVEGHASSDGNPQFNQMLSENRAMNVATLLRSKGVKDSQMEVAGYGSDHPLKFGAADDPTKDRRVEIIPIVAKY